MRIKGGRPPLAGGRTGAVDSSSPTHKGSINQVTSSVRGSFGALPLRPTAMIRRTSCEVLLCASVYYAAGITAFDEWNCRADVACVGADLRVRPQNRLRSGEDGRTHRSAPTVGAPTPTSGSPKRSHRASETRKNFAFYLHMNLESKGLLVTGTRIITRHGEHVSLLHVTGDTDHYLFRFLGVVLLEDLLKRLRAIERY